MQSHYSDQQGVRILHFCKAVQEPSTLHRHSKLPFENELKRNHLSTCIQILCYSCAKETVLPPESYMRSLVLELVEVYFSSLVKRNSSMYKL